MIVGSVFTHSYSKAEGSAGARGGGTGIFCDGFEKPILLEEYMMQMRHLRTGVPESRESILPWLREKLGKRHHLYKDIKAIWEEMGSYDHWESVSSNEISKELTYSFQTSFELAAIEIQMQSLLHSLKFSTGFSDLTVTRLVGDDYFELPVGCRKVQLSIISPTGPKKISGYTISESTKRYIELHEAIYSLGLTSYQHLLPVRTRELLIALNSLNETGLGKAIRNFVAGENERKKFWHDVSSIMKTGMRKSRLFHQLNGVTGLFILKESERDNRACPPAFSISSEGEGRVFATFLENDGDHVITVERVGRHIQYGELDSITFYSRDHSIFKNKLDVMFQLKDELTLLGMTKRSAMEAGITPIPRTLKMADGKSVTGCSYLKKNIFRLDEAETVKIWNSLLPKE